MAVISPALLHDAAEDAGGRETLEYIRNKFGDRVADIVEHCSGTFEEKKPPWKERKKAYIGQVIDDAVNLLNEITGKEILGENEEEEIFEMLINEVDYEPYAEWSDWQLDLLRCCASLVDKETLRNKMDLKLNSLMAGKMNESWFIKYYEEKVKHIKYNLIRQCYG